MAQKYRRVDPRFWSDERVQELPGPEELLLAIHMFTGPQSNRIGMYSFSPGAAAEYCKIELGRFPRVMETVLETLGWRFYAPRKVLWLPTWWRYNTPENPKVLIGNLRDLHDVPITPLDVAFYGAQADLKSREWSGGGHASKTFLDTYREKYPERIRIVRETYKSQKDLALMERYWSRKQQEQKQEQEQERTTTMSAREGSEMRSAFEERVTDLELRGDLAGDQLAAAREAIEMDDWQRVEELCAAAEGEPYTDDSPPAPQAKEIVS